LNAIERQKNIKRKGKKLGNMKEKGRQKKDKREMES
jgi:hypothetical protein